MPRNCFRGLLVPAAVALFISLTATSTAHAHAYVYGGNISLTFATPVAGSDFSDVVDNTSCNVIWEKPPGHPPLKVTVQTNLAPSQATATLWVKAINVSGGNSVGKIQLTIAAKPMVTGILAESGGCDLEYTAIAYLVDGPGTDVHTITFTMIE